MWIKFPKSLAKTGLKNKTRWYPCGIQILVSTYVFCGSQNSKFYKCQDMPKFELLGGGVGWGDSPEVKTQNLLSAKCQDLPKIQLNFLLGGGGGILPKSKLKIF